jgi:hypothetical protein
MSIQNGAFPWVFGNAFSRGFFIHTMQTHPHPTALRAEAPRRRSHWHRCRSGEINGPVWSVSHRGTAGALDRLAQITEHKHRRPHARPFRLRFARVVAVLPVCSPATLQALWRPRPSTLAAVNLAPAIRHGCCSAGLACPLGSSTAAGSSVRLNQGLKARPRALNRFTLARKGFIAHF